MTRNAIVHVPPLDPASLLTADRRQRDLDHVRTHDVDVLVIGGGITGAGVALDAATRGMSVALVEQDDLANGTSRWSSKLIHGGLRYLAKGAPGVAWESALERAVVAERMAPHLVHPLAQVIPDYDDDRRTARLALLGQKAGDVLRAAAGTPVSLLPRARHVDAATAISLVPGLRREGLRGASVGWDCQLVDDARLVVAVARTAAAHGARILTRVRVDAVDPGTGEVRATDTTDGSPVSLRAGAVVNATGVWADTFDDSIELLPSLGTHVVVPTRLVGAGRGSLTVPIPGTIGRFVFSLPQPGGISYVGLTDHESSTRDYAEPPAPAGDVSWILEVLSMALARPVTPGDAIGAFAGVRPLVRSVGDEDTADISRRHMVQRTGRLITVTGGKLTTFRRMAQDVVDLLTDAPCRTRDIGLVGAGPVGSAPGVPDILLRRYGDEAAAVWALGDSAPQLRQPIVPGAPYFGVEAAFGVAAELAMTVDDLVSRRTRLSLVTADRQSAADRIADLVDDLPTLPSDTGAVLAAG